MPRFWACHLSVTNEKKDANLELVHHEFKRKVLGEDFEFRIPYLKVVKDVAANKKLQLFDKNAKNANLRNGARDGARRRTCFSNLL